MACTCTVTVWPGVRVMLLKMAGEPLTCTVANTVPSCAKTLTLYPVMPLSPSLAAAQATARGWPAVTVVTPPLKATPLAAPGGVMSVGAATAMALVVCKVPNRPSPLMG